MRNKYIVEFIGTFFLVLVVALSGNPIAIGSILMAMVYMGGYISGAHYNPAISTMLLLQKQIDSNTWLRYVGVQFLAAICASAVYWWVKQTYFLPSPGSGVDFFTAFLMELIFTFALCSVVIHTAATEKTKGNNYYGLAIGFTVAAGAFAVGPISGGAFNPAVGIGPLLLDFQNIGMHFGNILLYLLGPLAGALAASLVYTQISKK
ncbi:MAG TPA: aquaporin [Candidatus Saccharimonadales bacterium]|nr:aquaporin [Candidatus Saccharimonadales bacterium]